MKVSTPKHTVWFIHKEFLSGSWVFFLPYLPYDKLFCESASVLQISLSPNGAFHNVDQFSWLFSEEGYLIELCCLKMIKIKVPLKAASPGSLINSSNEDQKTLNTSSKLLFRYTQPCYLIHIGFHYCPIHIYSTSNLAVYKKTYSHLMNTEFRQLKL